MLHLQSSGTPLQSERSAAPFLLDLKMLVVVGFTTFDKLWSIVGPQVANTCHHFKVQVCFAVLYQIPKRHHFHHCVPTTEGCPAAL